MKQLLVLAVVMSSCTSAHPDDRITRELHALWDARPPAWRRTQCADYEAARQRVMPALQLVLDASAWTNYDKALPAPIATRLQALELPDSFATDVRCVLFDVDAKNAGLPLIGKLAALVERKGELAVDAGHETGWHTIAQALQLPSDPPSQLYVWFIASPPYLLERAAKLAARHPPPPMMRDELLAAADHSVARPAVLCNGISEELLEHASFQFFGHVTDLRTAFVDRWGIEVAPVYDDPAARKALPSYDKWVAYRTVWTTFVDQCMNHSPAEARTGTRAQLEALHGADELLFQLVEPALERADLYERARGDVAAFRAQLTTL